MATLTATKILRGLAGKDVTIYNDKLKDGTRSYKIQCYPNWTDSDYANAAATLWMAGFTAKVVEHIGTDTGWGLGYRQLRLHVKA